MKRCVAALAGAENDPKALWKTESPDSVTIDGYIQYYKGKALTQVAGPGIRI